MVSWTTSTFALSVSTLTFFSQGQTQSYSQEPVPTARIYGGQITKTCEFPQTVSVGGCTGTLVHPRVVLSAAHCGRLSSATFGEHARNAVAKRSAFSWCEQSASGGKDAQICVLKEPMTGVPIVPIAQGCELDEIKKGAKVLLSGFGYDENDPAGGSPGGEKRWVETDIRLVKDNFDIHIGGGGKGGCNGDSGGPAFLQMKDGTWRTIGATHAGATPDGAHPNCDTGVWKSTGKLMKWYEEMLAKHNETEIDLSPCFDDQGKWAPNKECGGYVKDLKGPFGGWKDKCGKDAPVVKYSATCGKPFAPNGDDQDEKKDEEKDNDKKDPSQKGNAKLSFKRPGTSEQFDPDEEIDIEVVIQDLDDIADVILMVDGDEAGTDNSPPYTWAIDPLKPGRHELQAIARDDDEKELAKTKTLRITVRDGEKESTDTSNPTPEDEDEKDPDATSDGDDESSGSDDDPENSFDAKGKDDSENRRKKGCAVEGTKTTPAMWSLVFLGGWALRRRRR